MRRFFFADFVSFEYPVAVFAEKWRFTFLVFSVLHHCVALYLLLQKLEKISTMFHGRGMFFLVCVSHTHTPQLFTTHRKIPFLAPISMLSACHVAELSSREIVLNNLWNLFFLKCPKIHFKESWSFCFSWAVLFEVKWIWKCSDLQTKQKRRSQKPNRCLQFLLCTDVAGRVSDDCSLGGCESHRNKRFTLKSNWWLELHEVGCGMMGKIVAALRHAELIHRHQTKTSQKRF